VAGHRAGSTDAPTSRPRRSGARRDEGVTFLEILVAIVLLGTVVVGILAAMRTGVLASSTAQEAAKVETALLNASDRVSRAPLRCAPDGYVAYVEAAIAGWDGEGEASVSVSHLQYDSTAGAFADADWVPGPCPGVGQSQVQRVTIVITGPNREVTRSMDVIKSRIGGRNV
jgi:hypothetical protein